jgi:tRNA-dihydrouridine synthase A
MTRHVLGLFRGVPGARAFRRHLSTQAVKPLAGMDVLRESMALVVDTSPDSAHTKAA